MKNQPKIFCQHCTREFFPTEFAVHTERGVLYDTETNFKKIVKRERIRIAKESPLEIEIREYYTTLMLL